MVQEDLIREFNRVDNLVLVIAGGGSPCQGLSLPSSERTHFRDERSSLFFSMADLLGLLENVVMDESDRNDISYRLGWMPYLAASRERGHQHGEASPFLLAES